MFGSGYPPTDFEHTAVESLGLIKFTRVTVNDRQLGRRGECIRMLRTEHALLERDHFDRALFRLGIFPEGSKHIKKTHLDAQRPRILRAEETPSELEPAFPMTLSLPVFAERKIG